MNLPAEDLARDWVDCLRDVVSGNTVRSLWRDRRDESARVREPLASGRDEAGFGEAGRRRDLDDRIVCGDIGCNSRRRSEDACTVSDLAVVGFVRNLRVEEELVVRRVVQFVGLIGQFGLEEVEVAKFDVEVALASRQLLGDFVQAVDEAFCPVEGDRDSWESGFDVDSCEPRSEVRNERLNDCRCRDVGEAAEWAVTVQHPHIADNFDVPGGVGGTAFEDFGFVKDDSFSEYTEAVAEVDLDVLAEVRLVTDAEGGCWKRCAESVVDPRIRVPTDRRDEWCDCDGLVGEGG